MSHLSAVNLALLLQPSNHIYAAAALSQSTARARHWQWSSLLNMNDDQNAWRDKRLDVSIGAKPLLKDAKSVYAVCVLKPNYITLAGSKLVANRFEAKFRYWFEPAPNQLRTR